MHGDVIRNTLIFVIDSQFMQSRPTSASASSRHFSRNSAPNRAFSLAIFPEESSAKRQAFSSPKNVNGRGKMCPIRHPVYCQLSVDKLQDAPFPLQEFHTGTPIP